MDLQSSNGTARVSHASLNNIYKLLKSFWLINPSGRVLFVESEFLEKK